MITRLNSFVALALMVASFDAAGQVPYDAEPTWTSTDSSNYSTGAAWADINNDGWLDLVIANGNDMAREHLAVYYNNGSGVLPLLPDWQSSDIDYHGHLSVSDVNKDGFVDVAVSVYLGPARFSQKGWVKLYLNNNGTLEALPSWVSADSMFTFSCAFGDANGDGYPDLAVACGEEYSSTPEHNRVYYNQHGRLDSLPGWKSSEVGYSYDVGWADFDNDGDLDLVFVNAASPNRLYINYGDSIGTVASWSSTDPSQYANSLFVADVNNDGALDLAVSDNNQLGGEGKFKIYLNNAGTLAPTPFWTSAFSGYGSGITLSDITGDGYADLIAGGWWQPCRIYVNHNGSFSTVPEWTSNTGSVVEAIVCGDYDNAGLDTIDVQFVGDGTRKLYYLPRAPLQRILRVTWNGDPDSVREYCYNLESGWISFGGPAGSGTVIEIRALASHSLDLAISNWDPTLGNYLFRNTHSTEVVQHGIAVPNSFALEQNFPNPFNPITTITFELPRSSVSTLIVYDLLGGEVSTLVHQLLPAGTYAVRWSVADVPSGVYFYRLEARTSDGGPPADFVSTRRMVVLR